MAGASPVGAMRFPTSGSPTSGSRVFPTTSGSRVFLDESLPRLFEEFFREKRAETRDIDGNGLGLAIVKRLVERAGGEIEAESTLGTGSVFRVRLVAA